MKLILGIGNPGMQYQYTKHNVGFDVIDCITQKLRLFPKIKFNGIYYEYNNNGEKIIFLKPQNYVNLSGEVLIKFVNFFKINVDDILIISDDLDQEIGSIKLKSKGSSGGHNGLKSIEKVLKTKEYKRIKIGISNNKFISTADYVLSKFSNEDRNIINESIYLARDIALEWINTDFNKLQSKYNNRNSRDA